MSRQDNIEILIINHLRRLQKLKELQASSGSNIDPRILLEIQELEIKIEKLQTEWGIFQVNDDQSSQINILIVDDDADWRSTLTNLLVEEGYVVHSANNEVEALQSIFETTFNFAIIDVRLQGGADGDESGLVLALAIRQLTPQTRVIPITGYIRAEQIVRALKIYNLDGFIEKNSDITEEILKTIKQHL